MPAIDGRRLWYEEYPARTVAYAVGLAAGRCGIVYHTIGRYTRRYNITFCGDEYE